MAQMSDLMFDIVAQDKTRQAFDAVGRNAANTNERIGRLGRYATNALRGMQANTANLAAQFQDIVSEKNMRSGSSSYRALSAKGMKPGLARR